MAEIFRTERLELARARLSDAAETVPLAANLAISRWTTRIPHPYTLQDAETFAKSVEQSGSDNFTVRADGVLVGMVSTGAQLGYWIGAPFWGKGYATEASRAVVSHWFQRTSDDLPSGHFIENTSSRHVLNKLGFVPTTCRDAICVATGETHLLQNMVLTHAAWQAQS